MTKFRPDNHKVVTSSEHKAAPQYYIMSGKENEGLKKVKGTEAAFVRRRRRSVVPAVASSQS